ncbi:hypothetical protein MMYC01_209296 [Madurella mycetomatis]|uniref:Uncharacterized protein n=1 Tax=Madurella mycetomatis TaxID=100816 RepID=A0A175W0E5_9PEZI|nr:hypothetical protein MMYC01_209296 [Madurella mycetomatis]
MQPEAKTRKGKERSRLFELSKHHVAAANTVTAADPCLAIGKPVLQRLQEVANSPTQSAISALPTLPDDERISELELADAEPRLRSQSPCSAASSDPEQRHPLVPDDGGEQNEEGPITPTQAKESLASIPRLSDDESNNDREVANAELSMQLSASQDRANLKHNIGRRRHCGPGDGEGSGPIEDSVTEHGRDGDITQPPRKRCRISTSTPTTRETVPKRQTRLRCTRPQSRQAQRPATKRPERRRSQRGLPSPRSPGSSALEEETVEAPVEMFEEWPLDGAVLKRGFKV